MTCPNLSFSLSADHGYSKAVANVRMSQVPRVVLRLSPYITVVYAWNYACPLLVADERSW